MALEIGGGITIGGNITVQIETGGTSPVNTVAPVVSGTATVGQTLSTTNGTWTGTATITFTYQWQRNGVNISSATSSTYTLVNADASNPIRCVVTGTNTIGNSSANSNATANVAAIAPGAPTIGTATATGTTTATVAFTAPGSNGGATITTYTATSSPDNITGTLSQAGSGTINMTGLTASTSYTFTVTATNSVGTGSASASSNSITTFATPINTVAPVVSGTATVGQTLSTTNGTWTGTATITFTYQWQRNGVDITSATNSTYTLVAADASNPIRCVVTGTNSYGNSSANSNATANVAAIAPGAPTIGAATATGESTATVAFTAPASNGGATITTYTATSSPAGGTGTLSQAGSGTISVTGLTQATTYTFTVTATNSVGTGSASAASNSITTTASYFNYNTLLLPGASTTFVDDASTNNFAVTINGDTKPNSLNPYSPGYYSNYFDGNGDVIYATESGGAFTFGTGDYEYSAWIFTTDSGSGQQTIFGRESTGNTAAPYIYIQETNRQIGLYYSSVILSGTTAIASNRWYYITVSRVSGTSRIFVNGVLEASAADSTNLTAAGKLVIGGQWTGNINMFMGYISNARVVKGSGVTSVTVPSTPLTAIANTSLLTCQSNRFIDNSSNEFTLTVAGNTSINSFQPFTPDSSYSTYGSGYFDGTGDYLAMPTNATSLAMGTGNFTIEFWINTSNIAQTGYVLQTDIGANSLFISLSGSTIRLTNAATVFAVTPTLLSNTWYHIAVVRSGTSSVIYTNGVAGTAVTCSIDFTQNGPTIGANSFIGYLSDYRIVKGTAVYTTTFTPPSAPLTAIANTSLLTLQNNQSVNNNVFLDNSSNNLFVTRNGNTTQGTFSPYGGNWSNYFDGTTDYLTTPYNTAFDFNTGDFTVECWFNHTGANFANYPQLFGLAAGSASTRSYYFYIDTSGFLNFGIYPNGSTVTVLTATTACTRNVWNHAALVRSSGTTKIYLNGVVVATAANQNFQPYLNGSSVFTIGREAAFNGGYFPGYISNFRYVKGTALYTTTFTPATTPLTPITNTSLLTCQSSRFIDNSINNFTVTKAGDTSVQRFSPFNPSSVTPTSYSGYFDGTGDYLTVPTDTAFNFGTGNFTVETWFYWTGNTGQGGGGEQGIIAAGAPGTDSIFAIRLVGGPTTKLISWWLEGPGNQQTGSTAINTNTWYHVALVRSGSGTNNTKVYLNGVLESQATLTNNLPGSAVVIGRNYTTYDAEYFAGYISNSRIVKGVAVYTGTFTVPTSSLQATQSSGTNIAAITGTSTSLLTLQSPTVVDNSTNNFTISTFGNTQPLTQNPFGYTSATTQGYTVSTIGGSSYFDGTGDYLTVPSNAAFNQLYSTTISFTIEFWAYITANTSGGGANTLLSTYNSLDGYRIELHGDGVVYWVSNGTNSAIFYAVPLMAWSHLAFVWNGTTIKMYLNGVNVSSATAAWTNNSVALTIGNTAGQSFNYNGYISDLRITRGTAVYTSNFVPPTAPLTAVQNTTFLSNMTSGGIIDYTMMNNMETVGNASLSTTVTKYGATSLYFDGTGDYLTSPNSTNFDFGSGAFTIQLWLYLNVTTDQNIIAKWWTGGEQWVIQFRQAGQDSIVNQHWRFVANNGSTANTDFTETSTTSVATSTWYHIALTRSGSSYKLFRDGTQVGSTYTNAAAITATTDPLTIGQFRNDGTAYLNGYVDDLSITKGYAVYTSNFTPPTGPLPTY